MQGLKGVGFNLTGGGDYDIKSKRLVNCGDGVGNQDAVNRRQMEKYVNDLTASARILRMTWPIS